jgi:hypothetical protein
MSTIECALYCKLCAKYNAHPPVYAMWTVLPDIFSVFTAPHIQVSIFNWTYLRCYRRYIDNSMRLILKTLCQIQRISPRLRDVNCGPRHLQWTYSSTYSGFNNQLNVSPPLLEICRQFNACYTTNLVPNTSHILQFSPCEQWSRTYTMYLQLRIFMPQYSTERICAAIGDITTIRCALYCKHGAKYSAHPPVYASWTVVQVMYNVITARHIQASIFKWMYRGCYWRYLDN